MKLQRAKVYAVILIVLLVLMENIFYLVDVDSINVRGVFNYNLVWFVPFTLVVFYNLLKTYKARNIAYLYKKEVLLLVLICIIASITCKKITGQPFHRGFLPQRNFVIVMLAYFVIRYWLKRGLIDTAFFTKLFMLVGTVSIFLFLLQVTVFSKYQFIHSKTNIRFGSMRLYVDSVLCVYLAFIAIDKYIKNGKKRNLFFIVVTFFYELFVSKGRLELSALIVTFAIVIALLMRLSWKKITVLFLGCVAFIVFLNSQYFDAIIQGVADFDSQSSTMNIRLIGRQMYLEQLTESPFAFIFGCGYPSELYSPAAMRAGLYSKVLLVDNGLYSILYVYGLLGFVIVCFWYVKMFTSSYRLYKKNGELRYFAFVIFQIILSYNIVFWWWHASWTMVTVLTMAVVEHKLYDKL